MAIKKGKQQEVQELIAEMKKQKVSDSEWKAVRAELDKAHLTSALDLPFH